MKFSIWLEGRMTLQQKLESLRPQFAAAAQKVYDAWRQDEFDELNGGGICHLIAEAIADILYKHIPKINAGTVSASCGEQHVWVMLYNSKEGYNIDIPYGIYEKGGGYTWTKIPDVQFAPEDITIHRMNRRDAKANLEYDG